MNHAVKYLLGLSALLLPTTASADNSWRNLFNGKDLSGWQSLTSTESFSVVDGTIKARAPSRTLDHLFYTGKLRNDFVRFKNFELELMARGEPSSNSGIFFHTDRTTFNARRFLKTGYEVQLNSTEKEKKKTGSLYHIVDLAKSPVDETEWFRVNIVVKDKRITVKLNGQQVVDYIEPANPLRTEKRAGRVLRPEGGAIALQAHDPDSVFYFKDIRIRRLP